MQDRSIGVMVFAVVTILVAICSQYAAIFLLLTGSIFVPVGSITAALAFVDGIIFIGVVIGGYIAGFGLWTNRSWAYGAAAAVWIGLFLASAILAALTSNFASAVLPTLATAAALVFAHRHAVRVEHPGRETHERTSPSMSGIARHAKATR